MDLKVGVVCDRGLNPRRPVNQDRCLALADRGLFAVFDGVGGQRAGEVASQTAADTIEEAFENSPAKSSSEMIRRAIQFANRDIVELAESDASYKTMATTVALLHFNGDRATVAHVGDSRVYRLEAGRFYRETIDHTDFNDGLRNGVTAGDNVAARAENNIINRALGVEPEVEIEVKLIPLRDGARFLLCSDGVYKHIPDEEIALVLAQNRDPQIAADELKRIVYQRGADDNLSAVVVQVGRAAQSKVLPTHDRSQSRASTSRSEPGNRIEVQLGDDASRVGETRVGGATRKLTYALIVLVLIAGAFYVGLRASEFVRDSNPQATGADPSDSLSAGIDEFHKGRYREAAGVFASLTSLEPENLAAWYWLGRSQLEMGDYQSAGESLERAALSFPDANLYGAAAYRAAGNKARADALLERYNQETRRRQRREQQ